MWVCVGINVVPAWCVCATQELGLQDCRSHATHSRVKQHFLGYILGVSHQGEHEPHEEIQSKARILSRIARYGPGLPSYTPIKRIVRWSSQHVLGLLQEPCSRLVNPAQQDTPAGAIVSKVFTYLYICADTSQLYTGTSPQEHHAIDPKQKARWSSNLAHSSKKPSQITGQG